MHSGNRIDTISRATLFRVIVLLVGIIYGTLHHYRVIPEDFNTALTVTLLLFLVEQFFEIGHKLDLADGVDSSASAIREYIRKDSGILGGLLKLLFDETSRSITMLDDGFKVSHSSLAIHSYVKFWGLLAEEQRTRGNTLPPLTVAAIHSCSMDIWDNHPQSPRLLDLQREFHRHGGKISRILCADGSQPDAQVRLAYSRMVEAGIDVRYFDISTSVVEHTFGWDFLYVRETHRVVIWDSFAKGPGGVINEAVYLDSMTYDGKNLDSLWFDIFNRSVEFVPDQLAS
jgi:hypothetical protein